MALCLLAGGCGSSTSPTVSSPLATELSYFPAGSPFVGAIATNPQGAAVLNAKALIGAFPLSQLGIAALESQLGTIGIDYQSDIEPLYGNPVAFGLLHVPGAVSVSGSDFLAVWVTKSASKLGALMKKLPRGLTPSGAFDGATLYHRAGSPTTIAVDGATAVLGSSVAEIDAALNRHAHGGGITSTDFSNAMGPLPQDALIRAFGSLTASLSTPQTATARKVRWIAAVRSYAATISAASTGLTARFRIDTSGGALTTADLPIAGGTAPPTLAGTLPIAVGVRDPAQSVNFIVAALQAADPSAYAQFAKGESAVKGKTGYDLQTFAGLLTGNMVVETDTRMTMGRADVSDPASAAKQLALLPRFVRYIHGIRDVSRAPGGFYAITLERGKSVNLGMVGNELVAGAATPAQLRAFATAPATPTLNAQGSLAFRISLLDVLRIVMKSAPSSILQGFLSTLGALTGSASAAPGALTGKVTLAVK